MDANLPNPEYALRDDARKSKGPSVAWAANHQETVLGYGFCRFLLFRDCVSAGFYCYGYWQALRVRRISGNIYLWALQNDHYRPRGAAL